MRNSSSLVFLFGCVLALTGPVTCAHAGPEQKASYGKCVKYRAGKTIEFPDFMIEYIGERQKAVAVYPRGFLYYDFRVSKGNTEKMISWTAGTGDIGPAHFEISGKRYQLELRHSDKLGKLKENELVIWQANSLRKSPAWAG